MNRSKSLQFDTLTIEVSKNRRDNQDSELIDLKCNLPFLPTDERNLVYKIVHYTYKIFFLIFSYNIIIKSINSKKKIKNNIHMYDRFENLFTQFQ